MFDSETLNNVPMHISGQTFEQNLYIEDCIHSSHSFQSKKEGKCNYVKNKLKK